MESDRRITQVPREQDASRGSSTFNQVKTTVADKLHTAAAAIRQKVEQSPDPDKAMKGYGSQASEWLEHSADYVRDIDAQKLKTDLQDQVRRNPGRSLLIAGAAGLILGALLRRR